MAKGKISQQKILRELSAIGFARATDFLSVCDGRLTVKSTDALPPDSDAAIASVECTSNGLKVKLYDKLKALELLGKHFALFDGQGAQEKTTGNNLLQVMLEETRKEIDTNDIPELQQTADAGDDMVESAEA